VALRTENANERKEAIYARRLGGCYAIDGTNGTDNRET